MARLYDNELNIRPEVAAALGYNVPLANAVPSRRNGAEVFGRILAGLFGTAAVFVTAVLVVAILGWLHAFTLTPQPGQLGASGAPSSETAGTAHHHATAKPSRRVAQRSVPVVAKPEQQSDAIPADAAESAAGVSDPTAQDPVQR